MRGGDRSRSSARDNDRGRSSGRDRGKPFGADRGRPSRGRPSNDERGGKAQRGEGYGKSEKEKRVVVRKRRED